MTKFFSILFFLLSTPFAVVKAEEPVSQIKLSRFQLQSSELIKASGEEISRSDYHSNIYWFPVKVPSTVLSGLVANKVYPDPYQGMNNMLIPDASDEFNKKYNLEKFSHLPSIGNPWKKPYWYRTSFTIPEKDKGKHFQLLFKGINYRAGVWLNGKQVADSAHMAGMFAQFSFDVTKNINAGAQNTLAVKIYPVDYPGFPAEEQLKALGDFFENGGPTGDIGKNVTMLCSVGWDWMPPVRDRNMGIWQPVILRTTGNVTIGNAHIKTDLPNLPDTSQAKISLDLKLINHNAGNENGTLKVYISPENFKGKGYRFSKEISIPASSETKIELNAQNIRQLTLKKPHLWWPSGYGNPDLYRIRLQYLSNGTISDDTSFVFGIRTVSSKAVTVPNKNLRRDFYVNGRRVHITGGAWVPDMMLNRDSTGYANEMRLFKNSNINLVRIWGGGITPEDVFWDLADRFGLLVWSDFWVTGDTHGEFKGSTAYPLEGKIFLNNVRSTIYRIRNHASLLVWTGGNEGHVRKELYDAMRDSIIVLDGTRPFIPCSSGFAKLPEGSKSSWPDGLAPGVYSGGPYAWRSSKEYYRLSENAKDWVFKDETGLPSQPPYNSLQKIIPNLVWDSSLPFPLNHSWGYHDAATGNGKYDKYYETMVKLYGNPVSMEDFSNKMQLMNATGYQGIFEAAGHKLNDIGGVMLWKLNAAFPSVIWQVFDWYLQPNAGYYFMQNACEAIHIQLNPLNNEVTVLNRSYHPIENLSAEALVYDLNSRKLYEKKVSITLNSTEVKELFSLSDAIQSNKGVSFVDLNLRNKKGEIVSHNFYWLSPDDNFPSLNGMTKTRVESSVISKIIQKEEVKWIVKFENKSDKVAFFIHPQIWTNEEEILPAFWSANYFSLAPGETMNASVTVPAIKMNNLGVELRIEGWNMDLIKLPL